MKRLVKLFGILFGVFCVIAISVAGGTYWFFARDLPQMITIDDYRPLGVTQLIAKDGDGHQVVAEYFKERRYLIPYSEIPKRVVHAFISAEDDGFFEHQGISPLAILRAAIANFKAGHVVQGGSTITQQVAKSLFLTPERSYVRKIREAILAYHIESNLSKEQILYLYLNQIYLGHGAYGIQAAAKEYFAKDVSELSLSEAAFLAGMPQAPSKYNPFRNPDRAKDRQIYVLRRMSENNYITQEEYASEREKPIRIYRRRDPVMPVASYYAEELRRYISKNYGDKSLYEDGLTVYLPADIKHFETAQRSIQEGLRAVERRRGYRGPIKVLSSEEERQKFLDDYRQSLIEERIPFHLLLPDGRIDLMAAFEDAKIDSDEALLESEEIYQAVVHEVQDEQNRAIVQIGTVKAILPMSGMEWARHYKDEQHSGPKPQRPSQVLTKDDVVSVKYLGPAVEASEGVEPKDLVVHLEQLPGGDSGVQGALVSIDAHTGYILAMVGGYRYADSEFNRAVQAERQPGSAFKPIIFTAAIEHGYSAASIIVDSPIVYDDQETGKWKPTNFGKRFYGDTTLRMAFIKSRNIPTIKIVQDIEVQDLIAYARRLGMSGHFNNDLSISLGSATTTLKEMTEVYAIYPRGGRRVRSSMIERVIDRDGLILEEYLPHHLPDPPIVLYDPEAVEEALPGEDAISDVIEVSQSASEDPPLEGPQLPEERDVASENKNESGIQLPSYPLPDDPDQVLDPRVAYTMTHLMKEVVSYGTGRRARQLGREAAGKTGTTNEYKDAWFIGFTPNVVTGVWVGYDDQKSLGRGETGGRAALPIWLDYMKEAVKTYPRTQFEIPPGITFAMIDSKTGKLAHRTSTRARQEAFIAGTEPRQEPATQQENEDIESEFYKVDFE